MKNYLNNYALLYYIANKLQDKIWTEWKKYYLAETNTTGDMINLMYIQWLL